MGKLFDHSIGADVHVIVETEADGSFDVKVSYPIQKLQAPLTSLLEKITAKVPFLQKRVSFLVNGFFLQLGVTQQAAVAAPEVSAPAPVAAAEAAPVEPAHAG